MTATPILTFAQPKPQSELRFTSDFTFRSVDQIPNLWRRFWYWALLGWTWEAL